MCPALDFSIACHSAWAPNIETREAWRAWAYDECAVSAADAVRDPALQAMPALQRRRLGFLGKMALEVAYSCLGQHKDVPTIFCSRHGEVSRSVDLLRDLASGEPLSPTAFGLSVHNAIGGMFSIARSDKANHIALSAGHSSVEHAVIEACGLLADGEKAVLLVVYDCPLPSMYTKYQDNDDFPFAWAWLIEAPQEHVISLSWEALTERQLVDKTASTSSLEILRFFLRQEPSMERVCDRRLWRWTHRA